MPIVECKLKGIKLVNAKWLDDKKPTAEDPETVRSRLVATEVNWYAREDCTQATPPRKVFRFIVSMAATRIAPDGSRRRLIARYDVSVAFFHADGEGKTAVIPPKELRIPGIAWFLEKALYGIRKASQLFGTYVSDSMLKEEDLFFTWP